MQKDPNWQGVLARPWRELVRPGIGDLGNPRKGDSDNRLALIQVGRTIHVQLSMTSENWPEVDFKTAQTNGLPTYRLQATVNLKIASSAPYYHRAGVVLETRDGINAGYVFTVRCSAHDKLYWQVLNADLLGEGITPAAVIQEGVVDHFQPREFLIEIYRSDGWIYFVVEDHQLYAMQTTLVGNFGLILVGDQPSEVGQVAFIDPVVSIPDA